MDLGLRIVQGGARQGHGRDHHHFKSAVAWWCKRIKRQLAVCALFLLLLSPSRTLPSLSPHRLLLFAGTSPSCAPPSPSTTTFSSSCSAATRCSATPLPPPPALLLPSPLEIARITPPPVVPPRIPPSLPPPLPARLAPRRPRVQRPPLLMIRVTDLPPLPAFPAEAPCPLRMMGRRHT